MRKFTNKTKKRFADRSKDVLERFDKCMAQGMCKTDADDLIADELRISPATVRRIRLYPKEPGTVSRAQNKQNNQ